MSIAPAVLEHYRELSESQRAVVGHLDGPLLVIAGPGSGKTHCIVLRALNLLLLQKAEPGEIVLCTFTEKAAFEMRDRLSATARKVGYKGDLSELTTSTIHGFCNRVLTRHRHRTKLGHGYETLDDLTQLLFILEHFDEIVGPPDDDLFLARWKTRWTAIEGARGYFDKITEELVEPCGLIASADPFIAAIGTAYRRYEQALLAANRVDFAHLQRLVHDMLDDPAHADALSPGPRYLLVDEYQDTNHVQEQLLLKLAGKDRNLCVVGDEDQSLYRFRGATVRNILERRHGRHVDRLLLYWTSEARKEDALMVLPYRPERVDEAGRYFDATVGRIRAGEFSVTTPPEAAICRECDLRTLCRAEGVIGELGDSEALAA